MTAARIRTVTVGITGAEEVPAQPGHSRKVSESHGTELNTRSRKKLKGGTESTKSWWCHPEAVVWRDEAGLSEKPKKTRDVGTTGLSNSTDSHPLYQDIMQASKLYLNWPLYYFTQFSYQSSYLHLTDKGVKALESEVAWLLLGAFCRAKHRSFPQSVLCPL